LFELKLLRLCRDTIDVFVGLTNRALFRNAAEQSLRNSAITSLFTGFRNFNGISVSLANSVITTT